MAHMAQKTYIPWYVGFGDMFLSALLAPFYNFNALLRSFYHFQKSALFILGTFHKWCQLVANFWLNLIFTFHHF